MGRRGRPGPAPATYHPSALLRIPDETAKEEARRQFLADLAKVAERLHLD